MPAGQVIAVGAGTVRLTTGPARGLDLVFQNNSASAVRVGDSSLVSLTAPTAVNGGTAGFGLLLAPGGSSGGSLGTSGVFNLNQWYVAFSAAGVVDYQFNSEE